MKTKYSIRHLVEKALYIKKLTPDIENAINSELTQLGYISDIDYEALELLMTEMDAGRIQLVPSFWTSVLPIPEYTMSAHGSRWADTRSYWTQERCWHSLRLKRTWVRLPDLLNKLMELLVGSTVYLWLAF